MQPSELGIGRLFDVIRDAALVADAKTERIVLWNQAAEAIFGYSRTEALELPLETLVPERLRAQHRAGLARYRATGRGRLIDSSAPVELPALRKTGEEITIELTLTPLDQAAAEGCYVLAIVREVTARRHASVRRDVLLRVARLAGEIDAEQLLTNLLNEMVAVVGGDAGGVYIWDEAQGGLVTVRSSLPAELPLIRPGEGVAGRAWVEQVPIIVNDYQREDNVIGKVAPAGIQAALAVPLNHQGRHLGALGISSFQPQKRFTPEDVEVLEILASTAAATLVELERSQRLAESEAGFRLLAENARDVIFRFRVKPAPGFEYISPAVTELTGYTREEIYAGPGPGRTFRLVHPDDQPVLEGLTRSRAFENPVTVRWVHKTGAVIWTEQRQTPVYDAQGELVAIEAVVRDITERKRAEEERELLIRLARAEIAERQRAEEELRERERQLAEAQQMAHLGSWEWDIRTNTVTWSRELYRIFGLQPEELEATYEGFLDRIHPDDREFLRQNVERALQDHQTFRIDHRIVRPDGSVRILHAQGEVILEAGRPSRMVGTAQDITERRRLEEERAQLIREQAARAEAEAAVRLRDEFLSVAAHELKTPVTGLRLATQLLMHRFDKERALEPVQLLRMLRTIDQQSDKLSYLISQLLDVSRIEAGKLVLDRQVTDIVPLIENVVQGARARTSHPSLVVRSPSQLLALVDPVRLEQVLTNLVDNAMKYSPKGTPIEIELRVLDPETLQLTVTDRGTGIPPEFRDRIFERFFQAHAGDHASGMGLGLYISRQIVELHGGRLEAEFPPEGGTRFVVSLGLDLG